jgi:oligopeptidase A
MASQPVAAPANPLLAGAELPRFAEFQPAHVEPAIRQLLGEGRARVAAIAALRPPTFASVVVPLEELRHRLARIWSPVGHLNAVMNSEELRAAYNVAANCQSTTPTCLARRAAVSCLPVHPRARVGKLDAVQLAVLERAARFRLAGVALPPERKSRFKAVMSDLSAPAGEIRGTVLDATNSFSHHVTDPEQLSGINPGIVSEAARRAEKQGVAGWVFGLDQPTYVGVITDAESAPLRRVFYEAWNTRASDRGPSAGRFDNTPVLEDIMRLRHEAARLLDFNSFAEYALADRMAHTVAEVVTFLRQLAAAARTSAVAELSELEAYAGRPLEAWDVTWPERLQQSRFHLAGGLREYLPLPRVLETGVRRRRASLRRLRMQE